MTVQILVKVKPGDEVQPIGPGIRAEYPTQCWAQVTTKRLKGRRCRDSGFYTVLPTGETVPYALCKRHAKMAVLEPHRLTLLAPKWDPVIERHALKVGPTE